MLAAAWTLAQAQPKSYFCTSSGTTLHYERVAAGTGKPWWVHTETVNAVSRRPDGGLDIDITLAITSKTGKSPVKEPVNSTVLVRADGTVVVDVARAAEEAARQMFSAFDFKSSGGSSVLPVNLAPGDVLPDIHAVVSWAGLKMTVDYTERSVLRRETITVGAGTYDCLVIQERKLEKAPLHRRERITLTWYTLGTGMVRHDTNFTDGRPETVESLVSVSR
ncbi:MAG: hypothetical protein J5737_05090 [Bacteroidales bacterium]|nr:hypothetical protein [Bacteroidales bacterium]